MKPRSRFTYIAKPAKMVSTSSLFWMWDVGCKYRGTRS